eukprot:CAMPEP_0197414348 /NCGR_PEP_ID=MMETSP1170-20131217/1077_1 /TAXON_ID=54406 /ORGANISM="Sarcinochrysis sp, Strain CCMP770" /LENGTH=71 /DNA_ID=CAMNT_0042941053 /DNA_START=380 /DNA_END=595 /DNA_ORIENTATION=+
MHASYAARVLAQAASAERPADGSGLPSACVPSVVKHSKKFAAGLAQYAGASGKESGSGGGGADAIAFSGNK